RKSAEIVCSFLAFANVDRRATAKANILHPIADRHGALDRPRRPLEGCEKPVFGALDIFASREAQVSPYLVIVSLLRLRARDLQGQHGHESVLARWRRL